MGLRIFGTEEKKGVKWAREVFLSPKTERLMELLYRWLPPPLSNVPIRYLLGVSLVRGYYQGYYESLTGTEKQG